MKKILALILIILLMSTGCSNENKFNPDDIEIQLNHKIEDGYDELSKFVFFGADVTNNSDSIIERMSIEFTSIYGNEKDLTYLEDQTFHINFAFDTIGKKETVTLDPSRVEVVTDYNDDIRDMVLEEVYMVIQKDDGKSYSVTYDNSGNVLEYREYIVEE